ncbi:MAG: Bug family tripartite tricarboxylate transporter substrate binding protein [Burkholderiales bacterium]
MKSMLLGMAVAMSVVVSSPGAQDYPNKPIRLVIPNSPGGALDVAARLTQPRMMEILGQSIVLDYRVAAGGVVGTNQVAQSPADGYTLIMVFDSFVSNPYLFKDVQYDPVKDFAPISQVVNGIQVLAAFPGAGAKNFAEFMQMAKTKGNALDFASAGPGTSSRFTIEFFKQTTGIDATLIHYKGGGPLVTALMGGQVPVTIMTMGVLMAQLKSGKVLPLAVTSSKRAKLLPDVPTVAETYPGFEAQSWLGLLAPAGTPRGIVERLHGAMVKTLATPDVREKFESQAYELVGGTPEAFATLIRNESSKLGRLIKERGIKLD